MGTNSAQSPKKGQVSDPLAMFIGMVLGGIFDHNLLGSSTESPELSKVHDPDNHHNDQ